MIRIDPRAMHDDKPCSRIRRLRINGEEPVACSSLQVYWIAHNDAWGNLICPFFFPDIVGPIGEVSCNQQQSLDDITHLVNIPLRHKHKQVEDFSHVKDFSHESPTKGGILVEMGKSAVPS